MIFNTTSGIYDVQAELVVCTVNTVGVMGAGIAKEAKLRYPEMYDIYRTHCLDNKLKVGNLWIWKNPKMGPDILCFPTKKHWRNPSRMEYLTAGLEKLVDSWGKLDYNSIAFPPLGCGHGRLKWNEVLPVMEKYLTNIDADVYICNPGKL